MDESAGESSKAKDESEYSKAMDETAGESSKAKDESESPEVGISQQVIKMMDNDDKEVTENEKRKERKEGKKEEEN